MQLPFSAPAISARSTPAHYYCSISISFAGESISSLHFLPLPPHGMGWDGFCRHRFTSVLARASSVSSSWDPASACCLDMTHLDRRMHRLHPTPANLSISFPARYTNLRFIQMSHSPSPFSTLVPLKLSCRHRHISILVTHLSLFHSACAPSPSIIFHSPVPAFSLSNPVRLPCTFPSFHIQLPSRFPFHFPTTNYSVLWPPSYHSSHFKRPFLIFISQCRPSPGFVLHSSTSSISRAHYSSLHYSCQFRVHSFLVPNRSALSETPHGPASRWKRNC